MRFLVAVGVGFLVALLGVLAADARESLATVGSDDACDKYASERGSNTNPGTYVRPFASPQKLSDSLEPGQTGCFFGGRYSESDRHWRITGGGVAGKPVTLKSVPGQRATYSGWMVVERTTNYLTVEDMNLDGSTAPKNENGWVHASPTIRGDHVSFLNNDVTNRNRGICFLVGQGDVTASDTLIQGNRIHNCGSLPATNHHHGIYASNSQDARILDNWIYKNADRGVQLYPNADGTLVEGNVIDRNGQGITFSGAGEQVSDGNEVRNNIISNSRLRWNVNENYDQTSLVGRNNTVHHNCLQASTRDKYYSQGGGINPKIRELRIYGNLQAQPRFADTSAVPANYRLRATSGCRAVYPGP